MQSGHSSLLNYLQFSPYTNKISDEGATIVTENINIRLNLVYVTFNLYELQVDLYSLCVFKSTCT